MSSLLKSYVNQRDVFGRGCFQSECMTKVICKLFRNVPGWDVSKVSALLKSYVNWRNVFGRGCSQSECMIKVLCKLVHAICSWKLAHMSLPSRFIFPDGYT